MAPADPGVPRTPNEIVIGLNTCIHNMRVGGFCEACTARQHAIRDGRCVKCLTRPSTGTWVGDGGVLAYTHGFGESWCDLCMAREQLAYAEKLAAQIPDIRARLAELEKADV